MHPISELRTALAKREAKFYRRLGLTDDEMSFMVEAGEEVITTSKSGVLKLMKAASCGPVEALRQMSGARVVEMDGQPTGKTFGHYLSLEDEMALIQEDSK